MPRVKRGTKRRAKRKKILRTRKWVFPNKIKLYRAAKEAVHRGLKFAYAGRKQKKRQYRSIWIVRIGAAAAQWPQLQPVHQRPEEGRRGAGPQDSGRPGRERCGGLCALAEQAKKAHAGGVGASAGYQLFSSQDLCIPSRFCKESVAFRTVRRNCRSLALLGMTTL